MGDCRIEKERLGPIAQCIDSYGRDEPGDEWASNMISSNTVAYSCGAFSRGDEAVEHEHDPAEIDLCRRLAAEAAATVAGLEVGMGSEAGDGFEPFSVAAVRGASVCSAIDQASIRRAFGGTIHPEASIIVEPLAERGRWWAEVLANFGLDPNDPAEGDDEAAVEADEDLERWRGMVGWFRSRADLRSASFVMIGESEEDARGCVFLRLALALTPAGSLVGISGIVVQT